MNFFIESPHVLSVLAVAFGMIFGVLLHRARVTDYDVIVNQFRLRDFTVVKVMFTAMLVGGVGVLVLRRLGLAEYHIKPAELISVSVGAAIFGAGMVIYGYCPGTGVAAVATGSVHALAGFLGMLVGGALYAMSFTWIQRHIAPLATLGKARLPDLTGIPDWIWFAGLALAALPAFWLIESLEREETDTYRAAPPPPPPQATVAPEIPAVTHGT